MKHTFKKLHTCMSGILSRIAADLRSYWLFCASLAAAAAVLYLLFHKICIFSIATGYPCPGCGMTRALALFVTLRWQEAFAMNPALFAWLGLLGYAAVCRYVRNVRIKHFSALCMAVCFLSIAIYVWRMFTLYPDTPPMTYYSSNILHAVMHAVRGLFTNAG